MASEKLSRIVADFETSLSTAISIGDTSFTLQSVTDDDGVTLSDGIYCFTLDRDNSSSKEYIVGQLTASTKTVSSISSVSRQGALTSNFQKAHRIGTNVIISDHSALNALVKILNGTGTIDPASPIGYDTDPTLSASTHLATKKYVDDNVNGGTVNFDNQILSSQIAGETVAAGNVVYLKASDSRWYLSDADDSTTYDKVKLGIALGAGTSGNTITGGVQTSGICTAFTGLTANTLYFISSTAGGVDTSGTDSVSVGIATSTTAISLDFKSYAIPTGRQKDALAGGGDLGTPSTSNKFVTEDYITAGLGVTDPVVRTYLNAASPATWTKPTGLKYVIVEVQAAGGTGGGGPSSNDTAGAGGGSGGYARKLIAASTLGSTETITIGATGSNSSFGTTPIITCTSGAVGGTGASAAGGAGGTATGGDVNIDGKRGGMTLMRTSPEEDPGSGADSVLGLGGTAISSGGAGAAGTGYGAGGAGGEGSSGNPLAGGAASPAIVIVTEYYI